MKQLINFKKQFVAKVLDGLRNRSGGKRQTMRQPRKRSIRPGHTLSLYTGLRTKQVRFLDQGICKSVQPVLIERETISIGPRVFQMQHDAVWRLAVSDGFVTPLNMRDFFFSIYKRKSVSLDLIKW